MYFPQDFKEFKEWVDELKHFDAELYHQIENYFLFKEADRKLGALLDVNSRRCSTTGMASDSVAGDGSGSNRGVKQRG